MTSLIRIGGSAAVQPGIRPGDLLVREGTLRDDGTTAAYVHLGYPGAGSADHDRARAAGCAHRGAGRGVVRQRPERER